MRISDWSSDVCSSDLRLAASLGRAQEYLGRPGVELLPNLCLGGADHLPFSESKGPADLMNIHEYQAKELLAKFGVAVPKGIRSEEHTSELQSLMRISYAVFCLKNKNK